MKLTRRDLGKAMGAVALVPAVMSVPPGALAQTPAASVSGAQRDWLAEARQSHAAASFAMARVEVPMATEPATRFQA